MSEDYPTDPLQKFLQLKLVIRNNEGRTIHSLSSWNFAQKSFLAVCDQLVMSQYVVNFANNYISSIIIV